MFKYWNLTLGDHQCLNKKKKRKMIQDQLIKIGQICKKEWIELTIKEVHFYALYNNLSVPLSKLVCFFFLFDWTNYLIKKEINEII